MENAIFGLLWTNSGLSCKILLRNRYLFGGIELANIKSAIKRYKQSEQKRVSNRVYRTRARTFVARARVAMEGESQEDAVKATQEAIQTLDKAAQKGIIHKNNAARRKSRLMKALAQMQKQS